MAVNREIWRPDIIEALFKDNTWMKRSFNADEYVIGGSVVHIPQSGGPGTSERNRTDLPAPIVKRADNDVTYPLDEYTSDPRLITDIDKKELSYDKRMSVIREETGSLMELVADDMLYKWGVNVPSANKIATTGGNATGTAPGATGNRKIILPADIRKAQALLNRNNVPKSGRVLILPSDLLDQLMSDTSLAYAFAQVVNLREGSVGRLYGFDLYDRAQVLIEDAAGSLKLPEAASATDDNAAALFYQESAVERALGTVDVFDNPRVAEYYGDIISFLVRAGGRARRSDLKGVGYIVARA